MPPQSPRLNFIFPLAPLLISLGVWSEPFSLESQGDTTSGSGPLFSGDTPTCGPEASAHPVGAGTDPVTVGSLCPGTCPQSGGRPIRLPSP